MKGVDLYRENVSNGIRLRQVWTVNYELILLTKLCGALTSQHLAS